jgi:hypothetical protein
MSLLALELSDVGILAADNESNKLLPVDGEDLESPAFALPDGKSLLVGRAAERRARLSPRQVLNRFWDRLNTKPLKPPVPQAQNHAEIACVHLAKIWENLQGEGHDLVIAVPGFFKREHLGLIFGITEELSIPLRCIVSLPVAAALEPYPGRELLHLDIHLHRSEVTLLELGAHLSLKKSVSAAGKGLLFLYMQWIKTIADEFVLTTRFDPLDQAHYEQELYDRLPGLFAELQKGPSVMFEMPGESRAFRTRLTNDLFERKSEIVFREFREMVAGLCEGHGKPRLPPRLQVTHRVTRLPGYNTFVNGMPGFDIVPLEPGSGALGALRLWDERAPGGLEQGVSFLTSRPWQKGPSNSSRPDQPVTPKSAEQKPTHVLYRHHAYRITNQPLIIGRGDRGDGIDLRIEGELTAVSRKHCSIQIHGQEVLLTDYSTYGTFVDGVRASGSVSLQLGQTLRLGTPGGEELRLIACVDTHET